VSHDSHQKFHGKTYAINQRVVKPSAYFSVNWLRWDDAPPPCPSEWSESGIRVWRSYPFPITTALNRRVKGERLFCYLRAPFLCHKLGAVPLRFLQSPSLFAPLTCTRPRSSSCLTWCRRGGKACGSYLHVTCIIWITVPAAFLSQPPQIHACKIGWFRIHTLTV
jgi:hypothetical protein